MQKYIRLGIYSIGEVLSKVQYTPKCSSKNSLIPSGKWNKIDFDGHLINMASDRYKLFATKGVKCVKCGVNGEYFAMERDISNDNETYHFNLYAIDKNGSEVLMTKHRIISKNKGGGTNVSNLEPMCDDCRRALR